MKKGHVFTPLHRLNLAKALIGKRKSKETNEKISRTMQGKKRSKATKEKHRKEALLRSSRTKRMEQHLYSKHEVEKKLDRRANYGVCHICGEQV